MSPSPGGRLVLVVAISFGAGCDRDVLLAGPEESVQGPGPTGQARRGLTTERYAAKPWCQDDADCSLLPLPACHVARCDAQTGQCQARPVPQGTACDDGQACSAGDRCQGGVCQAGPDVLDCSGLAGVCGTAVCDPKADGGSGACVVTPQAEGQPCDADGSGCTVGDRCEKGACVAGTAAVCSQPAGPCSTATCVADGPAAHHCSVQAAPDGTACTADDNGCTADTCQAGACSVGPAVDCMGKNAPCGAFYCQSTGPASHVCSGTAFASKPPLTVEIECKLSGGKSGCPSGYFCYPKNPDIDLGHCIPEMILPCDDGDACTTGDTCDMGTCAGPLATDCDDEDACTLDTCAAGGCQHEAIPGCSACLQVDFDAAASAADLVQAAMWSEAPSYVQWQLVKGGQTGQHVKATWKGPGQVFPGMRAANLQLRRLFLDPAATPHLSFRYRMVVQNHSCGQDDLRVRINGIDFWSACDTTTGKPGSDGWVHVALDLTPWSGAPVDLVLQAAAGLEPAAGGSIEVDRLRVTGKCGPACVGGDFEIRGPAKTTPSSTLPQAWKRTSTAPGYAAWQRVETGGHTGKSALQISYAGPAPGGVPAVARLVLPHVTGSAGSKLWIATRIQAAAQSDCGADDLHVRIGDKTVLSECTATGKWVQHKIELTPWAGTPVDVTVEVVTGAGPDAQGTFEIDDIAVTGACHYACFAQGFDEAQEPLGAWVTGASTGALPWSVATALAASAPAAATLPWTAATPVGAQAYLRPHGDYRWVMPVTGVVLTYKAHVSGASGCSVLPVRARMLVQSGAGFEPEGGTEVEDSPYVVELFGHCATAGWETFSAEVAGENRARKFMPQFLAVKGPGAPATVAIDDVLVLCR